MQILALINAHHLAHVSRPLEIAKVLRQRGHRIAFAGHGKYLQIAAADGFEIHELPYISRDQLVAGIQSVGALYRLFSIEQLRESLRADLALYEAMAPDLVLVDNRITGCTSAEIAGIPAVGITNTHMSTFRQIPFSRLHRALRWLPSSLARRLDRGLNRAELKGWDWVVMGSLQRLRREYALPPRFSYQLEQGDMTLLADIPEFNPAYDLAPTAHFVGPLTWRNNLTPPCDLSAPRAFRRRVYFSLGSESLEHAGGDLGALGAYEEIQWVLATGGSDLGVESLPDNVVVQPYINVDALLPECDAVICHGGNGTLYQALTHGLPIVGVATHAEQAWGLNRVVELDLGLQLGMRALSRHGFGRLAEAVHEVLDNPLYTKNAAHFRQLLAAHDGPRRAARLLEQFHQGHLATTTAPNLSALAELPI